MDQQSKDPAADVMIVSGVMSTISRVYYMNAADMPDCSDLRITPSTGKLDWHLEEDQTVGLGE